MSTREEEESKDFFKSLREKSASELYRQWERLKKQEWWTLSKMLMAFSVLLIFIAGVSIAINILISSVTSTIESSSLALLLSGGSLAVTLLSPTILFLVLAAILGSIAFGASIATGNSEVIYLKSSRNRYIAHSLKLVAALVIFAGYYQMLFQNEYISLTEFIFFMFGVTGILLLPVALLCWGVGGLWRERKSE